MTMHKGKLEGFRAEHSMKCKGLEIPVNESRSIKRYVKIEKGLE